MFLLGMRNVVRKWTIELDKLFLKKKAINRVPGAPKNYDNYYDLQKK